jgi:uncharacterized protein (DUF2062 family)
MKKQSRSRLFRIYRYAYLKCVRQHHEPERVGRGMALGIFVGIFPTLWLGPILTVAGAGLIGANRAAALIGNVVCGPLTPLTWTLSVIVGNWMVREEWQVAWKLIEERNATEVATRFFGTFLVGNVAVSLFFALVGYALVWWLADRRRRRKHFV